jgi:hypothetical protein
VGVYEQLVTVLSSMTVGALVTAGLAWFLKDVIGERIKNAIKHEYDQKLEILRAELKARVDLELENYKAELAIQNTTATERLKSDLQIAANEHQIRFTRLHEKVAGVVAETYLRLKKFAGAVHNLVEEFEPAGTPTKPELLALSQEALQELSDYFGQHCLYLPKELANRVTEFVRKFSKCARDFKMRVIEHDGRARPDLSAWTKISDELRAEGYPLFSALEDEFRKMLGVRSQIEVKQSEAPVASSNKVREETKQH